MKPGLQSDMGTFLLAGPGLRIWVLTLSIHIGLSLFICRICVSVLNIYVCKPYYSLYKFYQPHKPYNPIITVSDLSVGLFKMHIGKRIGDTARLSRALAGVATIMLGFYRLRG